MPAALLTRGNNLDLDEDKPSPLNNVAPPRENQVAALLKDFEIRPVVVHPTNLAARLQGGAIRGRVCAFLTTRAEHPRTLKRAGGEKT